MTTSTRLVRTARAARGRAAAFLIALGALLADGVARADESELILPDLGSVTFLGMNGRTLLMGGILVCLAGLAFGLVMYGKLKNLPVHKSMLEVSELIYETCKTYLVTQGKFILILELFIGTIIAVYYGVLRHMEPDKVVVILAREPRRHRRELRRRVVRHPDQHVRELAHGLREPQRASPSPATRSPSRRACRSGRCSSRPSSS